MVKVIKTADIFSFEAESPDVGQMYFKRMILMP